MKVYILTGEEPAQDTRVEILGVFATPELAQAASTIMFKDGSPLPEDIRVWVPLAGSKERFQLEPKFYTAQYELYFIEPYDLTDEPSTASRTPAPASIAQKIDSCEPLADQPAPSRGLIWRDSTGMRWDSQQFLAGTYGTRAGYTLIKARDGRVQIWVTPNDNRVDNLLLDEQFASEEEAKQHCDIIEQWLANTPRD